VSGEAMTLEGVDKVNAVLRELGPRIERKVTRGAMSGAATPVVKAARANARTHKRSGGLAKSAGKRVKTYTKNGVVYVAVGYLWKKGGYHGHLVEFGHRMVVGGTIRRDSGRTAAKSKRTGKRGGGRVAGRVKGYPILRPAWDATRSTCLATVVAQHQTRVEQEAAKLAAEKGAV